MLYRMLKRLIGMGKTEGLEEKIDVFYAAGKLTESEYNELTGLIKQECKATKTVDFIWRKEKEHEKVDTESRNESD